VRGAKRGPRWGLALVDMRNTGTKKMGQGRTPAPSRRVRHRREQSHRTATHRGRPTPRDGREGPESACRGRTRHGSQCGREHRPQDRNQKGNSTRSRVLPPEWSPPSAPPPARPAYRSAVVTRPAHPRRVCGHQSARRPFGAPFSVTGAASARPRSAAVAISRPLPPPHTAPACTSSRAALRSAPHHPQRTRPP